MRSRDLGHRDGEGEAGDEDDESRQRGEERGQREDASAQGRGGERRDEGRDRLEDVCQPADPGREQGQKADDDADPRRGRHLVEPAAEEPRRGARRDAEGGGRHHRPVARRVRHDGVNPARPLRRPHGGAEDADGHLVEPRQLPQVHIARLDAEEVGLLPLALAEGGEDRRGRREEFARHAETERGERHHLLEGLGGVAVGVQGTRQPEDEADRVGPLLAVIWRHAACLW